MFEHLDDPRPFIADPAARARIVRTARSRRRRRAVRRSALLGVGGIVAAATAGALLVDHRLDGVERIQVEALARRPEPGGATTVLVLGWDSAPDASGSRADTVLVLRVDPSLGRAVTLSLPRDLSLDVPGQGPMRLSAASMVGGPSLLVDILRADLGIEVDRVVGTDFSGAVALGDALGGVRLSFDRPMRDRRSGFVVRDPGCTTLDGRGLLALSRARHLEALDADGTWTSDRTGDQGRIERQQVVGLALLGALHHLDLTSPSALDHLLTAARDHLVVDDRTGNDDLVALVRFLAGADLHGLRLPVTEDESDGAAVLRPGPGAAAVVAAFERLEPQPVDWAATSTSGPREAIVPRTC